MQLISHRRDNFPNAGVGNYSPRARSGWQPVFINQVLLEHRHTHVFAYYCGCFHPMVAELGSCNRDHMACKAENTYWLALHRKHLPALALMKNKLLQLQINMKKTNDPIGK